MYMWYKGKNSILVASDNIEEVFNGDLLMYLNALDKYLNKGEEVLKRIRNK